MREQIVNGHRIDMYDSIYELPEDRAHIFNRNIMIDGGIGSDMSDFDKHTSSLLQMVDKGDKESAKQEIMNMRQNIYYMMQNINHKSLAFAVMVKAIDGKPCDDISDLGLKRTQTQLTKYALSYGMIKTVVEEIKKKLRPRSKYSSLSRRTKDNKDNFMFI